MSTAWKKFVAWLPAIAILESGVLLMSFAYMGKRRPTTPGEANAIARLFLDDPTRLESFLFYFVSAHVLIFAILFVGWVVTRRRSG